MKTLHFVDKQTLLDFKDYFDPQRGFHYLDLPDGGVVVATAFHREENEQKWLGLDAVDSLPRADVEGTISIAVHQAAKLLQAAGPAQVKGKPVTPADVKTATDAMDVMAALKQTPHHDRLTAVLALFTKPPALADDTVIDVGRKLGAVHPLMKLTAF